MIRGAAPRRREAGAELGRIGPAGRCAVNRRTITVYRIIAGNFRRDYYTNYHAEQMARALRLNGMDVTIQELQMPADALTELTTI